MLFVGIDKLVEVKWKKNNDASNIGLHVGLSEKSFAQHV